MSEGLPGDFLNRLKVVFKKSSYFDEDRTLRGLFVDEKISNWQANIPNARSPGERTDQLVDALHDQYNNQHENVLLLFTHVLKEKISRDNSLHQELEQLIEEFQKILKETRKSSPHPSPDHIDFVNRTAELDNIFQSVHVVQYWVVDAPVGYGKTSLLREVRRRYAKKGWACCYLEIEREAPPGLCALGEQVLCEIEGKSKNLQGSSAEEVGSEIATALLNTPIQNNEHPTTLSKASYKGLALLLDNIEVLEDATFSALGDAIIGIFNSLNFTSFFSRGNQLRVFLSGRDIRRRSTIYRSKSLPYTGMSLSPYTFTVVEEAVRQYTLKANYELENGYLHNLSARFMYFNGGHPGCITDALTGLKDKSIYTVQRLLKGKREYLDRSFAILEKLESNGNQEIHSLIKILETLSVFRSFGPWLLKILINKGYISWEGDAYQLRDALLSTYLLHREGAFLQDSITQRLFSTRLRDRAPEKFKALCRLGADVYWERLCSHFRYPEELAVEYIYQQLQCAYHTKGLSGTKLRRLILESLNDATEVMSQKEDVREVFPHFLSRLKEDQELEFFTNYFINEVNYDHSIFKNILSDFKKSFDTRR